MSNIVTRNMRCPTCSAVGTHVIDASMRNEPVLCPACAASGKRSVCVAVIEPTEEQKQAARLHLYPADDHYDDATTLALARLLAEREAQHLADIKALREQRDSVAAAAYAFVHATRERGAAMPKSMLQAWDRLLSALGKLPTDVIPAVLAHYDDAKADAGAVSPDCPKCTDDAYPVGDGRRWVCSVCRRPCRIPLSDAEGGEG